MEEGASWVALHVERDRMGLLFCLFWCVRESKPCSGFSEGFK